MIPKWNKCQITTWPKISLAKVKQRFRADSLVFPVQCNTNRWLVLGNKPPSKNLFNLVKRRVVKSWRGWILQSIKKKPFRILHLHQNRIGEVKPCICRQSIQCKPFLAHPHHISSKWAVIFLITMTQQLCFNLSKTSQRSISKKKTNDLKLKLSFLSAKFESKTNYLTIH